MAENSFLLPAEVSAVIEMALSDHIRFEAIEAEHGLNESIVTPLMRESLKSSSYRSWRKRLRRFGARLEHCK